MRGAGDDFHFWIRSLDKNGAEADGGDYNGGDDENDDEDEDEDEDDDADDDDDNDDDDDRDCGNSSYLLLAT